MAIIEKNWRRIHRSIRAMAGEDALRLRLMNIGHLLAGNFGNLVVNLGAVAIAARALGPTQYGVLALVTVFVQAIERFASFQTWQPMIRYGAELDKPGRRADMKALVKFLFLLDAGAATAAWLVAVLLALFGTALFDWTRETLEIALIYATALLTAINGSPVGVLRLAGRFRAAAYMRLVSMVVRLVLCVIALFQGWELKAFVIIWAGTTILGNGLLIGAAALELKRKSLLGFLREPIGKASARFDNIWRFSVLANISVTIRSTAQQFDTLLVGVFADPAMAGFYHIAKRVAKVAEQAGSQVQSVVFPEIAKHWAEGNRAEFKRIVVQTEWLLAGVGAAGFLAMLLAAEPLVTVFAGEDFAPAAPLLTVQMIAVALVLNGSTSRVALLSMGREIPILYASIASTVAFYVSAAILLPQMGAMGANLAHIILGIIWVAGLWWSFRRAYGASAAPPDGAASTAPVKEKSAAISEREI